MFEFFTESADNALAILKSDHEKVKGLFEDFENAESRRDKRSIAAKVIEELKIHATIEEEIFYAALRRQVDSKIMNEADEEHHVAKVLIAELSNMDGTEDHYDAKFKVLSENIRHHIREEEGDMFPKARATEIDFEALGQKLLARKEDLKKNGVPEAEEDRMIARVGINNDSPARLSRKSQGGRMSKPAKSQPKRPVAKKAAAKAKPGKASKVIRLTRKPGTAKKAVASKSRAQSRMQRKTGRK